MEKPYYQSIVDTLKSVRRPGCYATGGKASMPLPAITLTGDPDTVLGLPLGKAQASDLIKLAGRAPFGKGEETIVDTSVRCTWQLGPMEFVINNPKWEKGLQMLLARVKTELGCDSQMKVSYELYKLLLYEPGGFFKRHQDTEKADGMFATLVIQLPSMYIGGKLIVYHQGKKSEFNHSDLACCSNCYFTAFYADCQHEVEVVTKGFRLCLIYNLLYEGLDECPIPVDNQKEISGVVSAIKKWEEDVYSDECPDMMTYLLEHQYCEASLSFRLLKNSDRAVADVLVQAKKEVDFDLFLGMIGIREEWTAEYHGYGSCEEVYPGELLDEEVHVEHLRASDGRDCLSSLEIKRESFVPKDFFDIAKPDEEKVDNEYTGNAGATLDRQYHRAALLLWPTRQRTVVVGMDYAIDMLQQDVIARKDSVETLAKDMLQQVKQEGLSFDSSLSFLQILSVIGDRNLIAELLGMIADNKDSSGHISDVSFYNVVKSVGRKQGWDILKSPLQIMFAHCSSSNVEKYCTFLNKTCPKVLTNQKDAFQSLLSVVVAFLSNEQDARPDGDPHVARRSKKFVAQLFDLLKAIGSNDLFMSVVSTLCSKPNRYPVLETIGPALVDISRSMKIEVGGSLITLISYCISHLETSICTPLATAGSTSYESKHKMRQQDLALLASLQQLVPATEVSSKDEPPAKRQKADCIPATS